MAVAGMVTTSFREREPSTGEIKLAGESLELVFSQQEVDDVSYLWREGWEIPTIADYAKRGDFDVAVLIMELIALGKLRMRPEGLHVPKREPLDRPKKERGRPRAKS